jgi:hypothetical protein
MTYRLLADVLMALHFLWVLFVIAGVILILWGIFFKRRILDWFWFRTIHLLGIIYVGALSIQGMLCPLTIWEIQFRAKADPEGTYTGSFIIHYMQKLVYPALDPVILQMATISLGIFTILVYFFAPPQKLRKLLKRE